MPLLPFRVHQAASALLDSLEDLVRVNAQALDHASDHIVRHDHAYIGALISPNGAPVVSVSLPSLATTSGRPAHQSLRDHAHVQRTNAAFAALSTRLHAQTLTLMMAMAEGPVVGTTNRRPYLAMGLTSTNTTWCTLSAMPYTDIASNPCEVDPLRHSGAFFTLMMGAAFNTAIGTGSRYVLHNNLGSWSVNAPSLGDAVQGVALTRSAGVLLDSHVTAIDHANNAWHGGVENALESCWQRLGITHAHLRRPTTTARKTDL